MTATAAPEQPPLPGQLPAKRASPKAKTPPSEATMKYPPPSADATMPTMGASRELGRPEPGGMQAEPGERAVVARIAEREDATVGRVGPVATAIRDGHD